MKNKQKVLLFFLTILTFGLILIKIKKDNNKRIENQVFQKPKLNFNIDTIIEAIGENNIKSVSKTLMKIKIEINDPKKIDLQKMNKIKAINGIVLNSDKIFLVTNEYTNATFEYLNNKWGKNDIK
ncbi:hypothetical protein V2E24_03430 [Mycoplasmopsis ciconiae]|uniref:Uncharacterized protein n=1 Tax=Mycoplasmopsis ciconiae TaxID=561067 RepID=A0ABU7MMU6_9BACT|nr:hypothetical protein [Mycoplasmopsis ciconiae]